MSTTESCKFNSMVECLRRGRNCKKCGWNPDVQEDRLAEQARRKEEEATKLKYISLDDALAVVRYSKDPVAGLESLPFILK